MFLFVSPIITFIVILLLPSALTFITLLIHRLRAARAAQRDRAPEDVVRNLPWRIWTGNGWEKHDSSEDPNALPSSPSELETGGVVPVKSLQEDESDPSTSQPPHLAVEQPWFETQLECAICLSEFAKGDKVRVLPCHHIFHLDEVDEWLIHRKKLVRRVKFYPSAPSHISTVSCLQGRRNPTSDGRGKCAIDRTRNRWLAFAAEFTVTPVVSSKCDGTYPSASRRFRVTFIVRHDND